MLEFALRPESTGDTGPGTVQDGELEKEQFMILLLELKALLLESYAEAADEVGKLIKNMK